MKSVEVNDALECDFVIAADRPTPDADQARQCPQCKRATWAYTDACMWCGHDRAGRQLRWAVIAVCALSLVVIFTLILGVR